MPTQSIALLSTLALLAACSTSSTQGPSPAPSGSPAAPEEPGSVSAAPEESSAGDQQGATAGAARMAGAPERIVALGDLHADLEDALSVLRMAGVVDEAGAWSGGQLTLVQTGDTTDRGPDSKEVIELLMRLEAEAEAAGGQVVALLGNHEVMNLTGDLRYVSEADVADFGGAEQRAAAFGPEGRLGVWLRQRDVVAKVGDAIFVHGGVTDVAAQLGVDGLNAAAHEALASNPRHPILGEMGPLWYRGYLQADETLACAEVGRALEQLGARRMVMGHTTQRSGRIAVRCGGAILGIDTGISSHYGDHHAALEVTRGDARALYPTGPEDLPDP